MPVTASVRIAEELKENKHLALDDIAIITELRYYRSILLTPDGNASGAGNTQTPRRRVVALRLRRSVLFQRPLHMFLYRLVRVIQAFFSARIMSGGALPSATVL